MVDNFKGGLQATEHLIKNGYKRIGLITISPSHLSTMKEREDGYKRALKENGVRFDKRLVAEVPFENLKEGVLGVLKSFMKPELAVQAVFVANNHVATACLEAAEQLGLRLPLDLAMVSFDDIELFRFCYPPVTAVAQPVGLIGDSAVDVLMDALKGLSETKKITLEPSLVIRKSCGEHLV